MNAFNAVDKHVLHGLVGVHEVQEHHGPLGILGLPRNRPHCPLHEARRDDGLYDVENDYRGSNLAARDLLCEVIGIVSIGEDFPRFHHVDRICPRRGNVLVCEALDEPLSSNIHGLPVIVGIVKVEVLGNLVVDIHGGYFELPLPVPRPIPGKKLARDAIVGGDVRLFLLDDLEQRLQVLGVRDVLHLEVDRRAVLVQQVLANDEAPGLRQYLVRGDSVELAVHAAGVQGPLVAAVENALTVFLDEAVRSRNAPFGAFVV